MLMRATWTDSLRLALFRVYNVF